VHIQKLLHHAINKILTSNFERTLELYLILLTSVFPVLCVQMMLRCSISNTTSSMAFDLNHCYCLFELSVPCCIQDTLVNLVEFTTKYHPKSNFRDLVWE